MASRGNGGFLVAAALAASSSTSAGTVHFQQFCLGVELLDAHLEGMDRSAADTAETVSLLDTVGNLRFSNKVPDTV